MSRLSVALALAAVLTCATGAAKGHDNVERLVALGKLWATIKYFHPGRGQDALLLGLARTLEQAHPWPRTAPVR